MASCEAKHAQFQEEDVLWQGWHWSNIRDKSLDPGGQAVEAPIQIILLGPARIFRPRAWPVVHQGGRSDLSLWAEAQPGCVRSVDQGQWLRKDRREVEPGAGLHQRSKITASEENQLGNWHQVLIEYRVRKWDAKVADNSLEEAEWIWRKNKRKKWKHWIIEKLARRIHLAIDSLTSRCTQCFERGARCKLGLVG